MRLLDLFCGAGGAAVGYHRAGFEVVGVDHKPQPNYPFEFHLADAMTYPLEGFDVIHASPPCQAYSATRTFPSVGEHPDLLAAIRARLAAQSKPWVIENVPGSPMRRDTILCGSMFMLPIRRHRWFETKGVPLVLTPPWGHSNVTKYTIAGHSGRSRKGGPVGTADEWRSAMEVPWMSAWEISQAIPPAYTEHIGRLIMQRQQRTERGQRPECRQPTC